MNVKQPLPATAAYTSPEQAPPDDASPSLIPASIGRYRVETVLGRGGFGLVYLAHDDQLQRPVAIKIPHAKLISKREDAEAYLAEARTVANLDHPHIVPVYDAGSTEQNPCFFVSKFIDGSNLAARLKQSRLSLYEAVELVATVAEALHYAHKQGLVHRDIKPGNILLDKSGKTFVGDFGLTLREQDVGTGPRYVGTPPYMSPEQARGEGHRVDGRSDVFSLGVVFYELLAGRRPFKGDSQDELLDQITSVEARPPRQIDDRIPKELDRICLKALSKRASERYSAAKDMADDLRHFLTDASDEEKSTLTGKATPETEAATPVSTPTTPTTPPASGSQPIKIVPKGLRSFDAHDADFFLELLPGPRDREGLPDSIRFWKIRIESTDADGTFSVGLLYGPSGCGKSSLVKAGLLPRLAKLVQAVYIETTPDETEARLLKTLRRQVPNLPGDLGLNASLAALRKGRFLEAGQKVLLVLDQFEQWLHARRNDENTELVPALRQCDGGRLQCLVMVRDDFWMAATRFMRDLEVGLLEGQNSAAVDLFPIRHAEKVLAAFGRAFGELPPTSSDDSQEQRLFVQQAVAGLAEEGKVISVRLALFAEMVKGKPWTPATLKEVGGTEGVGVTFLEETFAASTAPPQHRLHQKAAQAVLKALLPEAGTDIKGHMRSQRELLEASGYANHPRDFADLMRILDSELRLVTPADEDGSGFRVQGSKEGAVHQTETSARGSDDVLPDGLEISARRNSPTPNSQPPAPRSYQLTHDYLVPSLRDWLTRKQRETRRGRAELRLAERAAAYAARPDPRHLPGWFEWPNILLFTRRRNWTPAERRMMRAAGRTRGLEATLTVILLIAATFAGREVRRRVVEGQDRERAAGLVDQLLVAPLAAAPAVVAKFTPYRSWTDGKLRQVLAADGNSNAAQRLRASIGLLDVDDAQAGAIFAALLEAGPEEARVLIAVLKPRGSDFIAPLWRRLVDASATPSSRLRAAMALADYAAAAERARWLAAAPFIVDQILAEARQDPGQYEPLVAACEPAAEALVPTLAAVFRDARRNATERDLATSILARYAVGDAKTLVDLIADAQREQFLTLFPVLERHREAARQPLVRTVDETPAENLSQDRRVVLGQRRVGAAIALLRQGELDAALNALRVEDDPESLTQFVHGVRGCGVATSELLECIDRVDRGRQGLGGGPRKREDRVLFGLLLALGDYKLEDVPEARRGPLLARLAEWHAHDNSSAVHGATGWLLRHWGQEAAADNVDRTPVPYSRDREWFTIKIEPRPSDAGSHQPEAPARRASADAAEEAEGSPAEIENPKSKIQNRTPFYITFVVFPAGKYLIGSPDDEGERLAHERRHEVEITRPFALGDREVTWAQFDSFDASFSRHGAYEKQFARKLTASDPAFGVNWFEAVNYCRWLTSQLRMEESEQCYGNPASLEKDAEGNPKHWPVDLAKRGFRLPTEGEWEVACRGATTSAYSFGNDAQLLAHYGWFADNSSKRWHAVGQLRPNLRGLFDVHGNLWEWCHDRYGNYVDGAVDNVGPPIGLVCVDRGGGWNSGDAADCRTAYRGFNRPVVRGHFLGFRLALVPFCAASE